jgi:hypothetical protein
MVFDSVDNSRSTERAGLGSGRDGGRHAKPCITHPIITAGHVLAVSAWQTCSLATLELASPSVSSYLACSFADGFDYGGGPEERHRGFAFSYRTARA